MTEDRTLFQQLVNNDEVQKMINDLNNLESLIPEGEDPDDVRGWEIAVSFTEDDIPRMIEELEELADDGE